MICCIEVVGEVAEVVVVVGIVKALFWVAFFQLAVKPLSPCFEGFIVSLKQVAYQMLLKVVRDWFKL